jgi:endonuclease/exonuclease/phosphatase family metal-dependent hydrolase
MYREKFLEKNSDFIKVWEKNLHLSAERVAQMIKFNFKNTENNLIFVNCHLHHTIEHEKIRVYQVNNILNWIKIEIENSENSLNSENNIVIFVGDFNALPNSESYNMIINNGFLSLFKEFHGKEPEKTFHNKMEAPFKDNDPEGCFDYIL